MLKKYLLLLCACTASMAESVLDAARAEDALKKAVTFFHEQVAAEGGYGWQYSDDLARGEGEGRITATQYWVQPPGTPTVGETILEAYDATSDAYYLQAARATAVALVRGQLESGGWDYRVELDPAKRDQWAYRLDTKKGKENTTTLDDDNTQAALRFLMRMDQALDFRNQSISEAVRYGLDKLLAAQYPIGAWPQRFDMTPVPGGPAGLKASYPEEWSREYNQLDYRHHYTLNDNSMTDCILTLLLAHDIYREQRYKEAALRGGDFFLLAQMPPPQPAWAQQYNHEMHPVWARKFEPPAISGRESQDVLMTLLLLFERTGEERFLAPVPDALAYFRASLLEDGRLARFYELQTNRPLFMTQDYTLTYEKDDLPTHYAFVVPSMLDQIAERYARATGDVTPEKQESTPEQIHVAAKAAIEGLDERGAWVEPGKLRRHGEEDPTRRVIRSATFNENVRAIAAYLKSLDTPSRNPSARSTP